MGELGTWQHLVSDCRVSRKANKDPVIEELNVGEAAEPQGRGTGRPAPTPTPHLTHKLKYNQHFCLWK